MYSFHCEWCRRRSGTTFTGSEENYNLRFEWVGDKFVEINPPKYKHHSRFDNECCELRPDEPDADHPCCIIVVNNHWDEVWCCDNEILDRMAYWKSKASRKRFPRGSILILEDLNECHRMGCSLNKPERQSMTTLVRDLEQEVRKELVGECPFRQ